MASRAERYSGQGLRDRVRTALDSLPDGAVRSSATDAQVSHVIDAVLGLDAGLVQSDGLARMLERWGATARAVREDDRNTHGAAIERTIAIALSAAYEEGKRDGTLDAEERALGRCAAALEAARSDLEYRARETRKEQDALERARVELLRKRGLTK